MLARFEYMLQAFLRVEDIFFQLDFAQLSCYGFAIQQRYTDNKLDHTSCQIHIYIISIAQEHLQIFQIFELVMKGYFKVL